MIHYQLRCDQEHAFDGWFRDSAAFERQAAAGLVECPACASPRVRRALMAPAIPRSGATPGEPPTPQPPVAAPTPARSAAGPIPAQVLAMLRQVRAEVERNCDYVGQGFAEEARRQARGDAPARAIYGETSPGEAEALRDEGIDVTRIPWVPAADA